MPHRSPRVRHADKGCAIRAGVQQATRDTDALAESDARLAAVLSGVTGHLP